MNEEAAYVIRLYECECNDTKAKISFASGKEFYETDMLENIKERLDPVNGKTIELEFKPFEIKTILVKRLNIIDKHGFRMMDAVLFRY